MTTNQITNLALCNSPSSSPSKLLNGKTVLVTRASGQSSTFKELLTYHSANVIEMPTIEICPPTNWEGLDNAIAQLENIDWLILTSSNAVEYFLQRLVTQEKDTRSLASLKIAVVGEKTAKILQKYCLISDFIPPNFIADSLVVNFPEEVKGKKILFPRVESGGREVLVKEFTKKGAEVIEVAAYQSCCPENIPPSAEIALQGGNIDVITFASSKTVKFFYELAQKIFTDSSGHRSDNFADNDSENHSPSFLEGFLEEVCIASIGPQTSETCKSLLGRVDLEASEHTLDGLTQALVNQFSKH